MAKLNRIHFWQVIKVDSYVQWKQELPELRLLRSMVLMNAEESK